MNIKFPSYSQLIKYIEEKYPVNIDCPSDNETRVKHSRMWDAQSRYLRASLTEAEDTDFVAIVRGIRSDLSRYTSICGKVKEHIEQEIEIRSRLRALSGEMPFTGAPYEP